MEWFNGTITEALTNYQLKNGILIVYIYHSEEAKNINTIKFNELWNSFDISLLSHIPVVAVRLLNNSEDAAQFSQYFPTPVFPVCYIIGLNGQPLEVVTPVEELTNNRLNASIKKSVELYQDQLKKKNINLLIDEKKQSEPNIEKNLTNTTSSFLNDPNENNQSNASLEERIQYARERLEQKRKEDAAKKEEEDRRKELERRNEGKLLAEKKEKNKDREFREMIEARKREKENDAIILQNLRKKIKKDKEERAKKVNNKHSDSEENLLSSQTKRVINKPIESDECRIQLKFSNGSTLVKTFSSKNSLQVVVDAVKKDGRQPGEFFLFQVYPHRQLKEYEKTLFDLNLTPSSALLVVPKDDKAFCHKLFLPPSTGTRKSYIKLIVNFFHTSFIIIFQFVFGIFGNKVSIKETENNVQNNEQKKKEKKNSILREGNIRRLRDESDESDKEGTWNGNSTQQL